MVDETFQKGVDDEKMILEVFHTRVRFLIIKKLEPLFIDNDIHYIYTEFNLV